MAAENKIKDWVQAVRPFSFTASMVPVFLGAALAVYLDAPARWGLLPLVVLASLCLHAGTNMVSDYYDYLKGVDRMDSFGGSRVLVEKRLSPKQVLAGGLAMFAVTAVIGLFFIWQRGIGILIIGVLGMAGGFLYSLSKITGMGDLAVFVLMGPLMVMGSFFVLTGDYSHYVLLASLPVGCLVAAILSANNLRDIETDKRAVIRTTASLLGHRLARWEYTSLVLGAFAVTLALIGFRILPAWSLVTLGALWPAVRNVRAALENRPELPERIATLDVQTAKLHLLFGALLIGSLLLEALA